MTSAFVGSSMLRLAQNELQRFIKEMDECLKERREALFTVEIGFSKDGLFSFSHSASFNVHLQQFIYNFSRKINNVSNQASVCQPNNERNKQNMSFDG